MEQYENANVPKYVRDHTVDGFRFLAEQSLSEHLDPADVDGTVEEVAVSKYCGEPCHFEQQSRLTIGGKPL